MLARRLRRRSSINPALGQCIVFAGWRGGRDHSHFSMALEEPGYKTKWGIARDTMLR